MSVEGNLFFGLVFYPSSWTFILFLSVESFITSLSPRNEIPRKHIKRASWDQRLRAYCVFLINIFPAIHVFAGDSAGSWLDTLEGRFLAQAERNVPIRSRNTRGLLASTSHPALLREPRRQVSETISKLEHRIMREDRKLVEKLCNVIAWPRFRRFYEVHYLMQVGYLLALVSVILHILDRQVEYTSRMDILWKSKLRVEQDEVETMRGINKILLENILPAHVADHFLATRTTQVGSRN